MPYKELTSEYRVRETTNGQTGTRAFVEDADGEVADLPTLGSLFDDASSHAWLRAREREKTVYGGKPGLYKWVISYSTPNVTALQNPQDDTTVIGTKDFDNLQKTMQLGVEYVSIDVDPETGLNPAYKWEKTYAGSNAVKISTNRIIPTGSFNIPQKITNLATFNGTAITVAGCVNNAEFLGFPVGTVLFLGHNTSENFEDDGTKSWMVEMQFQWRIIRVGESSSVYLGWNYFLRREYNSAATEIEEGWDRILHQKSGNPIYPSADFETLIV